MDQDKCRKDIITFWPTTCETELSWKYERGPKNATYNWGLTGSYVTNELQCELMKKSENYIMKQK